MLQKKICMLGASGVGKTSLVQRFVQSIYSDKYHTTIGVKIDKKNIIVGEKQIMMMLWDVQGEDDTHKIRAAYLRGASGYLLVVDSTRPETLDTACSIKSYINSENINIPFILVVNKTDLIEDRKFTDEHLNRIKNEGLDYLQTSAKNGDNVEEAFQQLAEKMIGSK